MRKNSVLLVVICVAIVTPVQAQHNMGDVRRGTECGRTFSTKSTDELIQSIQNGEIADGLYLYELGRRNDPRLLSLTKKIAHKYESKTRRQWKARTRNPVDDRTERYFRKSEVKVEAAAKEAAARLGDKESFDEFVAALSGVSGRAKLDAIMALEYIGDRSAIKSLIPLLDDAGSPVSTAGDFKHDYRPMRYSDAAVAALKCLIPKEDLAAASATSDKWPLTKDWMKYGWWPKNKGNYSALTFGQDNAFK